MENVAGEQDLALQQHMHFPYKTSKFTEISKCRINLFFHYRGLKLKPFCYLRCALSIFGILYVIAHNIKILQ